MINNSAAGETSWQGRGNGDWEYGTPELKHEEVNIHVRHLPVDVSGKTVEDSQAGGAWSACWAGLDSFLFGDPTGWVGLG
jgi:hypothetical protein